MLRHHTGANSAAGLARRHACQGARVVCAGTRLAHFLGRRLHATGTAFATPTIVHFLPIVRLARRDRGALVEFAYPRPQLRRRDWTSLNGRWRFRFDHARQFSRPSDVDDWPLSITVPFAPETEASSIADQRFHSACW